MGKKFEKCALFIEMIFDDIFQKKNKINEIIGNSMNNLFKILYRSHLRLSLLREIYNGDEIFLETN